MHNLRDIAFSGLGKVMPYAETFDEALKEAVEGHGIGEERDNAMVEPLSRPDAHPSFEHLLPIPCGCWSSGDGQRRKIMDVKDGSMNWAQFRFGSVEV